MCVINNYLAAFRHSAQQINDDELLEQFGGSVSFDVRDAGHSDNVALVHISFFLGQMYAIHASRHLIYVALIRADNCDPIVTHGT